MRGTKHPRFKVHTNTHKYLFFLSHPTKVRLEGKCEKYILVQDLKQKCRFRIDYSLPLLHSSLLLLHSSFSISSIPEGIQRYRDTGIQEKRNTEIQKYRDTGMKEYSDTGIQILMYYWSLVYVLIKRRYSIVSRHLTHNANICSLQSIFNRIYHSLIMLIRLIQQTYISYSRHTYHVVYQTYL